MSNSFENTTVLPKQKEKKKNQQERKPDQMPLYHLILWNDDDHSYEYVITMLQSLFGYKPEKGFVLADTVDKRGNVIVLTTTKEYAEFKQAQIHAFGPDLEIPTCAGAMTATVEPADYE